MQPQSQHKTIYGMDAMSLKKKNSKRTENLNDTIENSSSLISNVNQESQVPNISVCEYCGGQFKTRHIMLKHIRLYCKAKKEFVITETEKDKEIEELKSQVKELISKVGNTTNNTINNQTYNQQTNVQQNNVNLNVFGKEDLSMLTDDVKRELIKGPLI